MEQNDVGRTGASCEINVLEKYQTASPGRGYESALRAKDGQSW